MLSIKGIGDPSFGQGGYSFLKMPVKTYNENNKSLKQEIDLLKMNSNNKIKTVTGTDADLRKLSKEDIKMKLIQLGVEPDYIKKLSRWERVSVLRFKSNQAAQLGYEGDITKYARGMRMNSKHQMEEYQKQINEVFKKQISFMTNDFGQNNIESEESSEGEENDLFDDNHEERQCNDEIFNEAKKFINTNPNRLKLGSHSKREKQKKSKNYDSGNNEDKALRLYKKNQHNNMNNNIDPNYNVINILINLIYLYTYIHYRLIPNLNSMSIMSTSTS